MKRTADGSVLDVWSKWYINNVQGRYPEDQDAEILQMEPGAGKEDYIVEVLRHDL